MASRHAADRPSLDRDANRVRDLPNSKARNLPQCPAFPGFDVSSICSNRSIARPVDHDLLLSDIHGKFLQ